MKHYIYALVLILYSQLALSNELNIGYFVTPPHVIEGSEDALPKGLVIDLWQNIAAKLGYTIRWKKMPLARLIKSVEVGSLDSGTLLVPTPPRKEILHFSDLSWDVVQPGVVVNKTNPLNKLSSAQDLAGLSIGYNNKGVITPWFKENDIKFTYIFGTSPLSRLIGLLEAGRLDAVYWPVISAAKYQAIRRKNAEQLKFIRSPKGPFPIKPFFPKNNKGKLLAKQLDQLLPEVKSSYGFESRKRELLNQQ